MTAPNDHRLTLTFARMESAYAAAADILGDRSLTGDPVTIVKASLLATIVDGLGAVLALLQSNGQSHTDTVVRSMMEAVGDLYNLCADPTYLDSLRLTSATKQKDEAKSFIERRVGHTDVSLHIALAEKQIREADATIQELEKKAAVIGPMRRIRAPDLPPDIKGVYGQHSFDAHHDITALKRRHFRGDHLTFADTLMVRDVLSSLSTATLVVACALDKAPEFLSVDKAKVDHVVLFFRETMDVLAESFSLETTSDRERLAAEVAACELRPQIILS